MLDDDLQGLVDGLSVALGRSVLLDDAALVPLAFSRQWGVIDPVRSGSILSRGASSEVRDALLAQGIARAKGPVRTHAVGELSMDARVCVPVRMGGMTLGFVWLLDPAGDLGADGMAVAERAAADAAELLARRPDALLTEESALVGRLCAEDALDREEAVRRAASSGRLAHGPIVALSVAARDGSSARLGDFARRLTQRAAKGHVLAGFAGDGLLVLLQPDTPVLRVVPTTALAAWAVQAADAGLAVGQSAAHPSALHVPVARRQAEIALRHARRRAPHEAHAAWEGLGAERLVAQLPDTAILDVPVALRRVLQDSEVLRATLSAYLDCGGDVKRTAERMTLHRSGVYYRLRRVQELTGLDLSRGDDRLLAQLAVMLVERS